MHIYNQQNSRWTQRMDVSYLRFFRWTSSFRRSSSSWPSIIEIIYTFWAMMNIQSHLAVAPQHWVTKRSAAERIGANSWSSCWIRSLPRMPHIASHQQTLIFSTKICQVTLLQTIRSGHILKSCLNRCGTPINGICYIFLCWHHSNVKKTREPRKYLFHIGQYSTKQYKAVLYIIYPNWLGDVELHEVFIAKLKGIASL